MIKALVFAINANLTISVVGNKKKRKVAYFVSLSMLVGNYYTLLRLALCMETVGL